MRLFVAVDPGPQVVARLKEALAPVHRLAPGAKWVAPESLHLTLSFLGEVDSERVPEISAAIAAVAARHAPIDLTFSGAGGFGGKRPRVLWVGIGGALAALSSLQGDLALELEPLGFPPEERAFTAHLTVARARAVRGDPALADCALKLAGQTFGERRIEQVVLYESRLSPAGARYDVVASHPLRG